MPNETNNIQLRSEEVQEILTAVPNWMIRWGNSLILVLVFMLLLISWFVRYPDIITTEAIVTTQTPPEKIYAKTTGRITHLLVKDGTNITKDSPIAIIENTANYQDVRLLKSVLDTIIINKHYFSFPIDDLPLLFLGAIDVDYALFENSYLQYELNKKLQPYTNEAIANRVAVSEMKSRLISLQSQKELNATELAFKKKDNERQAILFEKGIISAQAYEQRQQEYLQAERSYRSMSLSISQLKESISNGHKTAKGTQINKTKEDLQLLKKVIQSFNRLKESVRSWENKYVLKSALNGKLTYLNVWNENQSVHMGDLVFTIIPENEENYIAKLKAPARNSGKIQKGQTVQIKLANYPNDEFGVLNGVISSISSVPNSDGFYLINVDLPNKMLTSYNKTIIFKQEMSGTADIITEDLRLIERFFYQLRNAIDR